MNYKVLTTQQSYEWSCVLKRLPEFSQDIYYTPEYYRLYENYGDGEAFCFVFEKNGMIALYPFLKNSVNVLGFQLDDEYFDIQGAYGYNGVMSSSDDKDFVADFFKCFTDFCTDNKIIAEFTRFHPIYGNHIFSKDHMQVLFDRKTVYIDLDHLNYEEIFRNYKPTTREQIRKARNRYQVDVKITKNEISNVNKVYEIYCETMNAVHSDHYHYFSREYFHQLLSDVNSTLFTCYYDGNPIAVSVVLEGHSGIHGHLVGVRPEFKKLSVYSLIYDANIRYGLEKKFRYFHFGGGATNRSDDTVLKFKQNFSKTYSDFFIGKRIHRKVVYDDVIQQWENANPIKREKLNHILLKYRY